MINTILICIFYSSIIFDNKPMIIIIIIITYKTKSFAYQTASYFYVLSEILRKQEVSAISFYVLSELLGKQEVSLISWDCPDGNTGPPPVSPACLRRTQLGATTMVVPVLPACKVRLRSMSFSPGSNDSGQQTVEVDSRQ